jgi:hypothetical protein
MRQGLFGAPEGAAGTSSHIKNDAAKAALQEPVTCQSGSIASRTTAYFIAGGAYALRTRYKSVDNSHPDAWIGKKGVVSPHRGLSKRLLEDNNHSLIILPVQIAGRL